MYGKKNLETKLVLIMMGIKIFIQKEIGVYNNYELAEKLLNQFPCSNTEYYLLDKLTIDFYHEWTVYDFF